MTKRAGDYMTKKKAANKSNLVNIENILIDENKSRKERIKYFYRQTKNLYRFYAVI